jgi:hypothetical protein
VKVLIAIHGAHSQHAQMEAQRETWLKDLKGADYRYFLGQPALGDEDVEYGTFPDGPNWEGHRRTWWLNRKTEALASYAIANGYDFVFKCDDDTYVSVPELLASGFEAHDYSGSMDRHYDYELSLAYEWAQGGAGYWLSRRSMEIVAAGLTKIRAEDFAVGLTLAANGIRPHHDRRYQPAIREIDPPDAITFHKVDAALMRRLHEQFLSSSQNQIQGASHGSHQHIYG